MSTKSRRSVKRRLNDYLSPFPTYQWIIPVTVNPTVNPARVQSSVALITLAHSHDRTHLQQQILNAKARHTYVAIMVVMFLLFILSRSLINFLNLR